MSNNNTVNCPHCSIFTGGFHVEVDCVLCDSSRSVPVEVAAAYRLIAGDRMFCDAVEIYEILASLGFADNSCLEEARKLRRKLSVL